VAPKEDFSLFPAASSQAASSAACASFLAFESASAAAFFVFAISKAF
jgi:hypothetical protein